MTQIVMALVASGYILGAASAASSAMTAGDEPTRARRVSRAVHGVVVATAAMVVAMAIFVRFLI